MRPIVDIYSTFLQRSFDQIFQEVALQNLPVVVLPRPRRPDRPGRPDASRRLRHRRTCGCSRTWWSWPPATRPTWRPMLQFALRAQPARRRCAIPRRTWRRSSAPSAPIELGQAEVYEWGETACLIAYGTLFPTCVKAAEQLREEGLRRRRHQRPLRQAAGQARRSCKPSSSCRWSSRWKKGRWKAASAVPCWRPPTPPGSTRATSSASACPTASSNTASAANCWPTWAWTSTASVPTVRRLLRRRGVDQRAMPMANHRLNRMSSVTKPAVQFERTSPCFACDDSVIRVAPTSYPGPCMRILVLGNAHRPGVRKPPTGSCPSCVEH